MASPLTLSLPALCLLLHVVVKAGKSWPTAAEVIKFCILESLRILADG